MKLRAIDAEMDFGLNRNLNTLSTRIEKLQSKLNNYNNLVELLDASKLEIDDLERELGDLIDQMLNGVCARYGNDSREYEMAGGTRKSDRIRKSAESRTKNNAKKLAQAANN
jgi:predicted nuclease with TOPRIM domain